MQIYDSFIWISGGMIPQAAAAYYWGKTKAASIRKDGLDMHSQPGQYGILALIATLAPALMILILGTLVNLLGWTHVPSQILVFTALGSGILGLYFGIKMVKPDVRARNNIEKCIRWMLFTSAFISIVTTFGILFSILFEAISFFRMESFWYFVTGTEWSPDAAFLEGAGRETSPENQAKFGSIPLFAGSLMITFIAMLVAVPVGLFAAIYLAEYAPYRIRATIKPILEILAGIPTVVYGFFAAITVAPLIVELAAYFGLEASFQNALASGLVMGVMIIPFISSLSDDVISSVPQSMRQGALALGTTKAEMIKAVVIPAASPGIISAVLLGISRALGETMIVVMAAGLRPNLSLNPLEDMTTVTVRIVDALTGDLAFDSAETLSAFALGLMLFTVTLTLNIVSVTMIRRFKAKYAVSDL